MRFHLSAKVGIVVSMLLGILLAACGPTVAPASSPADAITSDQAAEVEFAISTQDVPREETLILTFEGGPIAAPDLANPYLVGNPTSMGQHQVLIESLFYLNYETSELMPWLAESYAFNDDFTEVTVNLREGITWSDGVAFTANDIVYTIEMLQAHPAFPYGSDMQQWVANVEAIDDQTVHFHLTNSYPRFLIDFFGVRISGAISIVPQHIWSVQDELDTFRNFDLEAGWPVWTGPYKMVRATDTEFVYDRRDDWWAAETGFHALPAPRRVIFVEHGSTEISAAMLENNSIDAHPRLPGGLYESVISRNPNILAWFDEAPYGWIDPCPRTWYFNTLREPWNEPDVRWALSYALNRQAIGNAELGGEGAIPAGYSFPAYPALNALMEEHADLWEQYPVTEFNPEKSIEILESIGFERGADGIFVRDGQRLQIDILVSSGWIPGTQVAPLMVGFWQEIGVDATANFLGGAQISERRNVGDFDILVVSPCYSVIDPFNEVEAFHGRYVAPLGERVSQNFARWSNPEFDAIVDEMARYPSGDPALGQLWREAMEIWLPELPVLPLYQQPRIVALNETYWNNWPTSENNYIHPPIWWATTLQMILNIEPAQQ